MNRNLAQGLLNIQYLIDPDVISLGELYQSEPWFYQRRQKAVDAFVDTKIWRNIPSLQSFKLAPIRQMPISTVPLSTGYRRKTNGKFYRTQQSNKRKQSSCSQSTFLPDVEVAVAQSDHASISIKGRMGGINWPTVNLINSTVPYLCSQQL